jgi:hypothetical protein
LKKGWSSIGFAPTFFRAFMLLFFSLLHANCFDAKRALNNTSGLGSYSRILLNGLMEAFPENDYQLFSQK